MKFKLSIALFVFTLISPPSFGDDPIFKMIMEYSGEYGDVFDAVLIEKDVRRSWRHEKNMDQTT